MQRAACRQRCQLEDTTTASPASRHLFVSSNYVRMLPFSEFPARRVCARGARWFPRPLDA